MRPYLISNSYPLFCLFLLIYILNQPFHIFFSFKVLQFLFHSTWKLPKQFLLVLRVSNFSINSLTSVQCNIFFRKFSISFIFICNFFQNVFNSYYLTTFQVLCALQYWDKSLNSFRTYSEFFLSEQQVTHLDLPLTSDRKKVSVSEKWRIALDYQDDVSDDNDDKTKTDIIVTPKSLVSVIRIDSYYNPNLIPKIQVKIYET